MEKLEKCSNLTGKIPQILNLKLYGGERSVKLRPLETTKGNKESILL
jgi:hypothetical protein